MSDIEGIADCGLRIAEWPSGGIWQFDRSLQISPKKLRIANCELVLVPSSAWTYGMLMKVRIANWGIARANPQSEIRIQPILSQSAFRNPQSAFPQRRDFAVRPLATKIANSSRTSFNSPSIELDVAKFASNASSSQYSVSAASFSQIATL